MKRRLQTAPRGRAILAWVVLSLALIGCGAGEERAGKNVPCLLLPYAGVLASEPVYWDASEAIGKTIEEARAMGRPFGCQLHVIEGTEIEREQHSNPHGDIVNVTVSDNKVKEIVRLYRARD